MNGKCGFIGVKKNGGRICVLVWQKKNERKTKRKLLVGIRAQGLEKENYSW